MNLRKQLSETGYLVGSWINTASPITAELMANCGFDFLTVDAEHSAVELPQAQALFQAIRSGNPNCAPLVRVPAADYAAIKRYMDAGAQGVVVPLINDAQQAREVVRAVKYPPQGQRGVGFCRDNCYGLTLDARVAAANEETLVCLQIEHVDGVRNLESILGVAGVDAVFIGPYDLTASMGITAQFDHPEYLKACHTVLEACRRHKVAAGIHVVEPNPEELCERAREGYTLLAYSLDITMLARSCQSGLQTIRARNAERARPGAV